MSHRFAAASAAILLCTAGGALAHHSYGEFDSAAVVEIDGKLRSATWVNPHASLAVEVTDAAGKTVVWDIETLPRNYFTRTGIPLAEPAAALAKAVASAARRLTTAGKATGA